MHHEHLNISQRTRPDCQLGNESLAVVEDAIVELHRLARLLSLQNAVLVGEAELQRVGNDLDTMLSGRSEGFLRAVGVASGGHAGCEGVDLRRNLFGRGAGGALVGKGLGVLGVVGYKVCGEISRVRKACSTSFGGD